LPAPAPVGSGPGVSELSLSSQPSQIVTPADVSASE
jgi:hypothetical protein